MLKGMPALVLGFFDWAWLREFCPDATDELEPLLGASGLHKLRRRLG
jgi:hypothetical protein